MAKYSQDVLCLHSHAYLGFHPSFWGRLEDLLALRTSCLGCILKSLAKAFLILCIYIIYIYVCISLYLTILFLSDVRPLQKNEDFRPQMIAQIAPQPPRGRPVTCRYDK